MMVLSLCEDIAEMMGGIVGELKRVSQLRRWSRLVGELLEKGG